MQLSKQGLGTIFLVLLSLVVLSIDRKAVDAETEVGETLVSSPPWMLNTDPISESGQKASVPSLAIGADGRLHTAFKQGTILSATANEAYYSYSDDGGATWIAPERIFLDPFSFVVDKVDIAVADNGDVHTSWVEKNNSTLGFTLYYAIRSNGTWSDPEIIEQADSPSVIDQPSLIISSGKVFVAWSNTSRIRFASKINNSWTTPIIIGRSELPELAIDDQGNLHLVYLESRDTLVARYSQSTDDGVTWSNDIGLSVSNKDVNDIDLALDGTEVHVVYGASLVLGGSIDPISSTPIIDPYYVSCPANCTSAANWTSEVTATTVQSGNAPADAILLVPSIEIIDQGEALIFYHGVLQENINFEQVLGVCFQPANSSSKKYKVPTGFTERMVKPQIVYSDGVMHMVYEQVRGQTASTDFQEIHYARLDVSCYDQYFPVISRDSN